MKKAVLVLLVVSLSVVAASAQDEAEYKRWRLDFERGKLGFVVMKDALGNMSLSWYLTYKVTNKTDQDVPLGMKIRAVTDTKKTYRDSIDPLAQKALQKETGKKYKNSLAMQRGTIAAGASIDAVAFFGEIDVNWDVLKVHVAGLCEKIDKVDGKLIFENKVLVLTYDRPGDEFGAADDPITFKGDKWVIEGERTEVPQK